MYHIKLKASIEFNLQFYQNKTTWSLKYEVKLKNKILLLLLYYYFIITFLAVCLRV